MTFFYRASKIQVILKTGLYTFVETAFSLFTISLTKKYHLVLLKTNFIESKTEQ